MFYKDIQTIFGVEKNVPLVVSKFKQFARLFRLKANKVSKNFHKETQTIFGVGENVP